MSNLTIKILMLCPCSNGEAHPFLLLAMFGGSWLLFIWIKTLIKSKGVSFMTKAMKIVIVVALVALVGTVFALKQKNKGSVSEPVVSSSPTTITESNSQNLKNTQTAETTTNLPRLVDLGADKCIPCKMMAPILEELKTKHKNILIVDFIDVWKNPSEAKKYNINVIPTQIFYDSSGKELFRHEGFFAKEDIIAKWKEFGIDLSGPK